jgi:hypothetical protein
MRPEAFTMFPLEEPPSNAAFVFAVNSKLIRFAYPFMKPRNIPSYTSLCALFWRVVLIAPLVYGAVGALCAGIAGGLGYWVYCLFRLRPGAWIVVGGLAFVALIFGITWLVDRYSKRFAGWSDRTEYRVTHSVVWLGAAAIKKRYCPIVSIVH